jgi:hypothetical protein
MEKKMRPCYKCPHPAMHLTHLVAPRVTMAPLLKILSEMRKLGRWIFQPQNVPYIFAQW